VTPKDAAAPRIAALTTQGVDRLCVLAAEIWHQHYPGIISEAQIEYMLARRYRPANIIAELQRGDVWWDQLMIGDRLAGFASCVLTGNAGEMKLDKLYVHPDHQRRGHGRLLLDRTVSVARAHGCRTLVLAVNKRNGNAIAAYRKYGFRVGESVVKDIGGGFVMDDYVMIRDLEHRR